MLPHLRATIDRRLLLNIRVCPEYWSDSNALPERLRPVVVNGWTVAGVCFLRLRGAAPRWMPGQCGINTEGAALRVACIDEENSGVRCVSIPQRWTNSPLIRLTDNVTPTRHDVSNITSVESQDRFEISVGDDGNRTCHVVARRTTDWPADSLFKTSDEASRFFACESTGFTITSTGHCGGGVCLHVPEWRTVPLAVESAVIPLLPTDAFEVDHALLMENAASEWSWAA